MKNFIAFDFETATPSRNSACAIGIVVVRNNVIIEKFFSLIKPPENNFSQYCINVHGITPEMTEHAPTFKELFPKIFPYFNNNQLVCHNASFDKDVLLKTMCFYEIDTNLLQFECFCTMQLNNGKGLKECCEENSIPLDHHEPLSDAVACAKLFLKNNNSISVEGCNKTTMNHIQNFSSHQNIKSDYLKPIFIINYPIDNPFYDKKVVITGTFKNWPDRNKIAKNVQKMGADIDKTVTDKTNILIAGDNAGPSKIQKINLNREKGFNSRIIEEEELIEIFIEYKVE